MKHYGAKLITLTPDLKDRVAHALQPYSLKFAYIFGSSLTGSLHEESDIDIAAYIDAALPAAEHSRHLQALISPLAQALAVPAEALDLALLNRAPLLLQHVVITEGRVLYERDHNARVEFELSIMRRRDDERDYRRLYDNTFLAHCAGGII